MWTVLLGDESKQVITSLSKELPQDIIFNTSVNNTFKLIQYLDPYGDTVFNHLQMDDLITDLRTVQKNARYEIVEEIIGLATKCKSEPHTYLAFYGD